MSDNMDLPILAEFLRAVAPFVRVGENIPPQWRRDVPLQRQSNLPPLPTVAEYDRLVRAHGMFMSQQQKLMQKIKPPSGDRE